MAKHASKGRHINKRKRGLSIFKKVIIGLVVVAVVVCIPIGVVSALWLQDLPVCDEDAIDTAASTEVYANDHETLLARFQLQNRIPITDFSQVSSLVKDATVDIEDERYYSHGAVDLFGIARAAINNATGGSREGASTITQQLVRNTVLMDEMNDISVKRKLREAALAFQVEQQYSKDDVLLMYLNTINYGSGAWGIEAAAYRYFSKPSSELTLAEVATLVGIPQSPTYNNPIDNPENALARRNTVLDRMQRNGHITQEQADAAKAEPITLNTSDFSNDGIIKYPYFTSYVRDRLLSTLSFEDVFEGGLKVYTTLDIEAQEAAEAAALQKANEAGPDFECALTAIDPNTGYVKAMVGGRDYHTNQYNLAAQAKRQTGSSFKTFTLVAALEKGVSPQTTVNCYPQVFIGDWKVHNYANSNYGACSIAQAFAVSSNTGFARLVTYVGPAAVVDVAHRMGITSDLEAVPAITLGAEEVTTLEMADAYATIANGGTHYDAVVVEKAFDRRGNVVIDNENPKGTRALSPEVAHAATEVMKGVVTGGTGTAARLANGQEAAGKTGTTEYEKDSWFCGITPQYSVAIWLGDRTNQKAVYNTATSAFSAFLNPLLEGKEPVAFPQAADPKYDKKFSNGDLDLKGVESEDPEEKEKREKEEAQRREEIEKKKQQAASETQGGNTSAPSANSGASSKPAVEKETATESGAGSKSSAEG